MEVDSLKNLAKTATTISIFYRKKPKEKLKKLLNDPWFWNAALQTKRAELLQGIAEDEVESLILPMKIKEILKSTIKPISLELLDWSACLNEFVITADMFSAFEEFCWKSNGMIDGERTVSNLVCKDSILYRKGQIRTPFQVALQYSPLAVLLLFQKNNFEFLNAFFKNKTSFKQNFDIYEFKSLTHFCFSFSQLLGNAFRSFQEELSSQFELIRIACDDHRGYAMLKFFLSLNKKKKGLILNKKNEGLILAECITDLNLVWTVQSPDSWKINLTLFFMKELNESEMKKLFQSAEPQLAYNVLNSLLYYPFRYEFLKYAKILLPFTSEQQNFSYSLLLSIANKMPQDLMLYEKAFSLILESTTDQESVLQSILKKKNLILALLYAGSHKNIKMIMNSVTIVKRKEFLSKYSNDILLAMTTSKKWKSDFKEHMDDLKWLLLK